MIPSRGSGLNTLPILVFLVVGSLSCGGRDAPGSTDLPGQPRDPGKLEEWALSESPVLEIGVREGEDPYQLHRVRGSVRLDDGRVVVLNAGSHELRYFDPEGRFLQSVGGMGEGPGEFRGPIGLRKTEDGHLQVWDGSLMRLATFDQDGRFRSFSTLLASSGDLFPGDDWLHGENWVVSPVPPVARGPIREAVDRLPAPDSAGTLRTLRVTPQGRIWNPSVRPPADSAVTWEIFDLEGGLVASLTTPPRFEPHEIGEDYMTGVFLDDVDVNYVRVYELVKPDSSPPGPGLDLSVRADQDEDGTTARPPSEEVLAGMRSLLKNMASLEEIYYANHYTYTRDLDALLENSRGGIPEDLAVDILYAGAEAWAVMVSHPESGGRCVLGYGRFVPMGWQPGSIVCL